MTTEKKFNCKIKPLTQKNRHDIGCTLVPEQVKIIILKSSEHYGKRIPSSVITLLGLTQKK